MWNRGIPSPNKDPRFLALLPRELAVLHFFIQFLFGFGARKKHANAEANVNTSSRCIHVKHACLLMSKAVSMRPTTLLITCKTNTHYVRRKKRLLTTPCAKSHVYRHNAPKRRDWCPVAEAYSSVNGPHKPPALRISKRRHPSENKQGACEHMRRNCKMRAAGNGGGSGGERLGCSHNTCLDNCLCFE